MEDTPEFITRDDILAWIKLHGIDPLDVHHISLTATSVEAGCMEVTIFSRHPEHGGRYAVGDEIAMEHKNVRIRELPGQMSMAWS